MRQITILDQAGTPFLNNLEIVGGPVYCSRVYFIQEDLKDIKNFSGVLYDPILEREILKAEDICHHFQKQPKWVLRKFFKFGVTDNSGMVASEALQLGLGIKGCEVLSGEDYFFCAEDKDQILNWAQTSIINPLVHDYTLLPLERWVKEQGQIAPRFYSSLASGEIDQDHQEEPIDFIGLEISKLKNISDQNHWALVEDELQIVKDYYTQLETQKKRRSLNLNLNPSRTEMEVIAQTWSEHCKHKIFAAHIDYSESPETTPKLGAHKVEGVFKTYIRNLTNELMTERPWLVSVFHDNAGVMRFSDKVDVCIKVETHNSPSALDPFGGALTGILGVQRDILGTGLGAEPIANLDIFCLGQPDFKPELPKGLKHPKVILDGVHQGVQSGGNKMGVPTVNGSFYFDNQYCGKPLVFCGTLGVLPPLIKGKPSAVKRAKPGDFVVMAGGRIGKDGIHGATLSSAEMNEKTPASMVQLGDPFTQRRVHDFLLQARDQGLFSSVTDNGAGGLSSSVGEMAEATGGAEIELSLAATKYLGLEPYEILVSESQERMTFAVPPQNWPAFAELAKNMHVEVSCLGTFTNSGAFVVKYQNKLVAALDLDFLHRGLPPMQLKGYFDSKATSSQNKWTPDSKTQAIKLDSAANFLQVITSVLSDWNVRSRKERIQIYDQEVKGASMLKPFSGLGQSSPQDAAVMALSNYGGNDLEGVSLSHGLAPHISLFDTYHSAQMALDEAIRSLICVGTDPQKIAILDNFSWPDPLPGKNNPDHLQKTGELVRACRGLYDLAKVYKTPFVSGKDSMKNDFIGKNSQGQPVKISVLPTVLVTAVGHVPNLHKVVGSQAKNQGSKIVLLGAGEVSLGGTIFSKHYQPSEDFSAYPTVDAQKNWELYNKVFEAFKLGLIESAHDVSEGGRITALCEMFWGSGLGAKVDLSSSKDLEGLYDESPGQILVHVTAHNWSAFCNHFTSNQYQVLGEVIEGDELQIYIKGQSFFSHSFSDLEKIWSPSW